MGVSSDLLPASLVVRPSQIPGTGMGVWSTKYIASGTQLTSSSGQIVPPGARTPHVWEIVNDQGEVTHCLDTRSSWTRHAQFARKQEEANVSVHCERGAIVFTICRDVLPGCELLHVFETEYARQLGIAGPSPPSKEGLYECPDCPRIFYNPLCVVLHRTYSCGKDTLLWCDECGQVFALITSLRSHLLTHNSSVQSPAVRPFDTENLLRVETSPQLIPPLLGVSPASPLLLRRAETSPSCIEHYHDLENTQFHNQQETWAFKCDYCPKAFSHHSSLKVHSRMHTGEKPFDCNFCHKSFARRDSLQAHVRTHTKPFICDKCGRSFARPDSLVSHARNHAGHNDRPFKCVECGKGFGVSQALQTHMRIHTGEKPFTCKHCPKAFAHMSSLKVHINSTHTGVKPFKCQHCCMRFADGSNLRRHIQTHTNEKPHICKQCGKAFARGSILKEHLRTHSRGERCGVCGERLTAREHVCKTTSAFSLAAVSQQSRVHPFSLQTSPFTLMQPTRTSAFTRSPLSAFKPQPMRMSLNGPQTLQHENTDPLTLTT